jgi:hypothetical protein
VEGVVGQVGELLDGGPVVEHLVVGLAETAGSLVGECQDAGAARVQPEAGLGSRVALCYSGGDGAGSTLVVRGIRGV